MSDTDLSRSVTWAIPFTIVYAMALARAVVMISTLVPSILLFKYFLRDTIIALGI